MKNKDKSYRHYVYILIDDSCDTTPEVFYVGKGVGNRKNSHAQQLDKFLKQEQEPDQLSNKLERMKAIVDAGGKPKALIVGRYDTADEAFAVEAALIHWMYGLEKLTNIQPGHNHAFVRNQGEWEIRDNLEREKKPRIQDGEYTQGWQTKWRRFAIQERLSAIAEFLNQQEFQTGDLGLHRSQDACFYLSIPDVKEIRVMVSMGINKTGNIQVRLAVSKDAKDNMQYLKKLVTHCGFKPREDTKHGPKFFVHPDYSGRTFPEHDFDEIIKRINTYLNLVNSYERANSQK